MTIKQALTYAIGNSNIEITKVKRLLKYITRLNDVQLVTRDDFELNDNQIELFKKRTCRIRKRVSTSIYNSSAKLLGIGFLCG